MLSTTWARLVGGIGASPPPPRRDAQQQRKEQCLVRFKRAYSQLVQSWRRSSTASADVTALIELVRVALERLTSILQEEARTPNPHPCLAFASEHDLPATTLKVAKAFRDECLTRAAISLYGALIEDEDEFLQDADFACSLMDLTDLELGRNVVEPSVETKTAIVELRFEVAAKIRLQPEILPAWFRPGSALRMQSNSSPNGISNSRDVRGSSSSKDDFPLFFSLLDYVHSESPIGDFARTGLLYIIEAASSVPELERWVVESDLATLMASGLGALYSQLNRKLVVSFPPDDLPTVLAFSDYLEPVVAVDTQFSTSPEFRQHMSTFLSDLMLWQDVLEHSPSGEIKRTLLDHFEILFLKQVLYPSLLESSDLDGGSSVAALTYLHRILDSLQHQDLIRLTLDYLLAIPRHNSVTPTSAPPSPSALKRRRTLDSVNQRPDVFKASPTLFNLVDLITTSLQSTHQQTVTATLKVVSVLLGRHHQSTASTIQRTIPASLQSPRRTIGAHQKEMNELVSLARAVGPTDGFDELYEECRIDCSKTLEAHPCCISMLSNTSGVVTHGLSHHRESGIDAPLKYRSVHPADTLLKSLASLLEEFLTNSVETNLSLTDSIMALASCGCTKLEGWLLVDPINYEYEEQHENGSTNGVALSTDQDSSRQKENERLAAMKRAQAQPSCSTDGVPQLRKTLQGLAQRLQDYRKEIPGFDAHFNRRRLIFRGGEEPIDTDDELSLPLRPRGRSVSSTHPTDSQRGTFVSSPSGEVASHLAGLPSPETETEMFDTDILHRKIIVERATSSRSLIQSPASSNEESTQSSSPMSSTNAGSIASRHPNPPRGGDDASRATSISISVNHLVTNAVILQEFMLELMAMAEVRASLLEDVAFL
ncbi:MAG: hypothetical protein M1823_005112 [Watsoniomyces obsoletus]|nr:MAG: hypothetical protein M1823_005112 [Watsoniomyces obsoletus]